MKHRQLLLLLLLLVAVTPAVSGEVAKQSDADLYFEAVAIFKSVGRLVLTFAAGYLWLMDVPLKCIFHREYKEEDEEDVDKSLEARLVRLSQYFLVVAAGISLLELVGNFLLAIQGTTLPGA